MTALPMDQWMREREGSRVPRMGGILGGIGRSLTPERLQGIAAVIQDLDPMAGGGHFDRFNAGREKKSKERAEAERRQALAQAYQASTREDGSFDPQQFAARAAQLGLVGDLSDVAALQGMNKPPTPKRYVVNGQIVEEGADGTFAPTYTDTRPEYVRGPDFDRDGEPDYYDRNNPPRMGAPRAAPQGAPQAQLPPVLSELPPTAVVRPPRPTEAPATVGAAPQGFKDRNEVVGFVQQRYSGRPTSGYRSQAEQDRLVARGVTRATRSSHTYANGQDFVPDVPQSEWPRIKAELEATGRFRRVIIETGRGRNQGTGAHIHLEPY